MRGLGRRISRVEHRTAAGRRTQGPALLIVLPDDWPPADRAALAGNDAEARADAVARHTGERPGPSTKIIAFATRPDGPA
jgi:hypothetical protein